MEALRRKTNELETQKTEIKNAQLSAERQKRALNEKVHELDNRIATLEAEKEQYDLENKSLINKLKVSGVKQKELDDANDEVTRLLGVIQELKSNSAVSEQAQQQIDDCNATIDALKERNNYLSDEKDQLTQTINNLNQQKEALDKTIAEKENIIAQLTDELNTIIEQQDKSAQQLADIKALQETIALLQSSLEESRKQCADLETSHNAQDANRAQEIAALQEQNNLLKAQLDTTAQQLSDTLTQFNTLNEQTQASNKSQAEHISDLSLQLEVANNNYHAAADQLENTLAQLATLQAATESLTQEKDSLSQQAGDLQAITYRHEQEKNDWLQEKATLLKDKEDSIQQAKAQHQQEQAALLQENKLLSEQLAGYNQAQAKVQELNTLNDTLQAQLKQAQQELQEAKAIQAQPAQPADSQELEKANNLIAALKKQRQDLVSQTATLRSQNKAYENRIAELESKINNLADDNIEYQPATDIDDAINWMMPIMPDQLEEEARRREEEERLQREEEERQRQAEKERQAARDNNSSQMSLW